jgi:Methyltransferase domain
MGRLGRTIADVKRRLSGVSRLRQYKMATPMVPTADMPDIERIFWSNTGPLVHKWLHYLPIYDRYLAKYRGTDVKMLEIGVYKGGSLHLWREYLGPRATIYGIDINPDCAAVDGVDGQVRIGSQADPAFLARVVQEMGGVDIVLDDGSHIGRHIRASLDALFPLLADNGLYIIEDVHTAYSRRYDGRFSRHNFMRLVSRMADDMHHWYHASGQRIAATADHLLGLHIYDSLVVLEKGQKAPPAHVDVGGTSTVKTATPAMAGDKIQADAQS